MAVTVKALQEERGPIGAQIRTMADRIGAEARAFTAEEQGNWDKLNADFNKLTTQIEAARSASHVAEEFGRRSPHTPGLEDTQPRGKGGASTARRSPTRSANWRCRPGAVASTGSS